MFVSDAWPAPAAYHQPFCEHCYDHRSDFHGAVVGFIDRYLSVDDSESRRFELPFGGVFSERSWPNICPGFFFFVFFFENFGLELFWEDFCAHSERYENIMADIVEIQFCFGNIAFPLLSVYTAVHLDGHFFAQVPVNCLFVRS